MALIKQTKCMHPLTALADGYCDAHELTVKKLENVIREASFLGQRSTELALDFLDDDKKDINIDDIILKSMITLSNHLSAEHSLKFSEYLIAKNGLIPEKKDKDVV